MHSPAPSLGLAQGPRQSFEQRTPVRSVAEALDRCWFVAVGAFPVARARTYQAAAERSEDQLRRARRAFPPLNSGWIANGYDRGAQKPAARDHRGSDRNSTPVDDSDMRTANGPPAMGNSNPSHLTSKVQRAVTVASQCVFRHTSGIADPKVNDRDVRHRNLDQRR